MNGLLCRRRHGAENSHCPQSPAGTRRPFHQQGLGAFQPTRQRTGGSDQVPGDYTPHPMTRAPESGSERSQGGRGTPSRGGLTGTAGCPVLRKGCR